MTEINYDSKNQTIFIAEEYDEDDCMVMRGSNANIVIVDNDLLSSYEGDEEDEDDEDYDASEYPGIEQMWTDYNEDGMSDTTKECVQVIPLSEIIEFYIKNYKG